MTQPKGWSARRTALLDRLTARATALGNTPARIIVQPEPRAIGLYASGRRMLRGQFMLAGHFVEAAEPLPWDIRPPHPAFAAELHGFGWLDHLAAVGDSTARSTAQRWLAAWLQRHGRGRGPGWTAELAGRRLLRWIAHALLLTAGQDADTQRPFQLALRHHAAFLARRWSGAPRGLPQFEALTGLLQAGVALQGMEPLAATARAGLARACRAQIGPDGGISSRNPEELLEIFTLLTWAAAIMSEAAQRCDPEHVAAIERIAVTLRTLRHADGGLARFHGGGRGMEGRLDHALAASNVREAAREGRAMGFARLAGGRTSVIADAAAPPLGPDSRLAHASTLGFELTSHRRQLIVSCGAGLPFGPDWERAARATASHSTLAIDGYSSARMGTRSQRPELLDGPRSVECLREVESYGSALRMSHDGYSDSHGLVHLRRLDLSADGRALMGEDSLVATTRTERKRVDRLLARAGGADGRGIAYEVRFHLHPDADASVDMQGTAISVALRSGEIWVFRAEGAAHMGLEPSVYLEKGRRQPRATQQIVLWGRAGGYTSAITWTLAKAQDTPIALRDIGRDDVLALPDY